MAVAIIRNGREVNEKGDRTLRDANKGCKHQTEHNLRL